MPTSPVQQYLKDMYTKRATGFAQDERSHYTPLENLLTAVGKTLKPKVLCLMEMKNQGAGMPDGGLFTLDQVKKNMGPAQVFSQKPSRGVIECKPVANDNWVAAAGEQVDKYWKSYRKVLVTNYRDFVLVVEDQHGKPLVHESFSLADSEDEFWAKASHPKKTADELGTRFINFLRRVLDYGAPITTPDVLAASLAVYAQEALDRVSDSDLEKQKRIRKALEESLGLTFEGEDGEHFFRSTLVQTLFYGVFSAWVLWARNQGMYDATAHFNWKESAEYLRLPVIRKLFHEITDPSDLRELRLAETLAWAGDTLNRVNWGLFFAEFDSEQAVEYFYEPFLKAFDPVLRKRLGVWFTPPEIVKYMVARVDKALRDELGVEDGLANDNVYVLDPCCGTGTFLVEVLRTIHRNLGGEQADVLSLKRVKDAAMNRVFGFEILPASFVVSHLRLGLLLREEVKAPLAEHGKERVGVYLTNALTGWEPPEGKPAEIAFKEFADERDAANEVKREKPILVVLGNPPYNAFDGVSPDEEQGLVEVYKGAYWDATKQKNRYKLNDPEELGGWGIKKFNLDDLYVRFFRVAERRIVENTGQGIVCFISNFSYLGDPSFAVMREHFLKGFNHIWIDNMNGDSRETGKKTPDGKPDPSVFSTKFSKAGIRVGTAIGLLIRNAGAEAESSVKYREFWGEDKRQELLDSLDEPDFKASYTPVPVRKINRFRFKPSKVSEEYYSWPGVDELCQVPPSNGLMEKRGGALIDIDRDKLAARMQMYFDSKVSWEEMKVLNTGLTKKAASFEPEKVRATALKTEVFSDDRLIRYSVRPFDLRWCYATYVPMLWNRHRPDLQQQLWKGNSFFVTRPGGVSSPEGIPAYFTSALGDNDFQRWHSYYFPLFVRSKASSLEQAAGTDTVTKANLSPAAREYLANLGLPNPDKDHDTAALIWLHALAVGYSPGYLAENADGIEENWPRIPLPANKEDLLESAQLGKTLAALLDPEQVVKGVTSKTDVRPELKPIAQLKLVDKGTKLNEEKHFKLDCNWGYLDGRGAVMPGSGKFELRDYTKDELTALKIGAKALDTTLDEMKALLGEQTYDVYLNDQAYWANVPANVWNYFIGGYQVIKKWLSYREVDVLGRRFSDDEVCEVQNMARRLAAILLMQAELDAGCKQICADSYRLSH